jgi:hypothetical protein
MDRIYQRASRVIAWIGRYGQEPASDGEVNRHTDIESTIDFTNLLLGGSQSTQYYNRNMQYYPNDSTRIYSNSSADWNVAASHPGWTCMLHLCKRPYWTRLWIIQELVLAREIIIQCGYFQLSWKVIEHVFDLTRPTTPQQLPLTPTLSRGYQIVAELADSVPVKLCKQRKDRLMSSHSVHTLFELFCLHQHAACTLVQDKLFGLLAMSRECCQRAVNVNYSMSPSTLCRVFVEHHFKVHVGSITTKNREDWIYGLRHAFTTFLDETYEGIFDSGRLISFHCGRITAIASIPCRFRGQITAYDDRISADPLPIVASFSRQSRSPLPPHLTAFPVERFTLDFIRRIGFYPGTNFQFKDVDKMGLPSYAVQPQSVPTDRSLITGGIGDVQPGDTVYQISEQHSLILRRGFLVGIGTGFGPIAPTYLVHTVPIHLMNDNLSDWLYMDYSNLWGCCELFGEGLKLPELI